MKILVKNRNFGVKLKFWCKIYEFRSKIEILAKNKNFEQIVKLLSKVRNIFHNFSEKKIIQIFAEFNILSFSKNRTNKMRNIIKI